MRKRIIALVVALVLAVGSSGTVLATTVADMIQESKQDAALKEENEKKFIRDLFHDQGHIYMTPEEPKVREDITLRLRTVRYNVTCAQIQYTTDLGVTWKVADMKFDKKDETGYYDLWKGKIPAEGDIIYYRFIVGNTDPMNTVYFDSKGFEITEQDYSRCWKIVPGHDVPDWAKGATWYSVLPDAFYNGNTTNDKQISGHNNYATWNNLRKGTLQDKYGGDLDGIEAKLDHIESLNVDAVFMNPTWKSYQNAGYGPVHYDEIESSFGNEEDLVELADAIHERDMKLMGDVVLTFAVDDSYYFNKNGLWPVIGASQSEDSEWKNMFKFYNWPDNYMTAWGSPAIDLNSESAKNLIYAEADSYLMKYVDVLDGYRFDCGGWLWGTSETEDIDSVQFITEIHEKIKAEHKDFMLLSESSNMFSGTWDSSWNVNYMPKLQDYAKGLINETLMTDAMWDYEMELPRNVALCMQNMLSDHDSSRVVQDKAHMFNAALLIQMTYLGAPSIYYGEEVNYTRAAKTGIGDTVSFYSMDWDESNWEQERLSFYRAITELRQEFSCIKTGVVNMLGSDSTNNTITFGRWDKKGAAITVTSQNEEKISVEIEAKKCDIPDGTIMTDWFSGAQYVVEDGKFTADVLPGGTVFVTGEKSTSYRQVYEMREIGNTSNDNAVTTNDTLSFTAEGKGTIDSVDDTITFTSAIAYDSFSVFANLRGDGKGTLMIRNGEDSDERYYAAVVDGDKLSIMTRTKDGKEAKCLVEIDCTKNTYVKLCRDNNNQFTAYKTEVKDGNLGNWEQIEKATVSIGMNHQVYYGFAPLKGEIRVNNVTFQQTDDRSTFDTFDEKATTSLFDNMNADFVSVKDGNMTIHNSKDSKLHYILTNSMEDDWTFKTSMNYEASKGNYAGVVSRQDEDNYVIAGRTVMNDENVLFIGKASNGVVAVYNSVSDLAPQDDVIIQLQRIGAYYSAVYSTDDGATWKYIGRLFANYANERVGVLVAGENSASFDWVSFGDSINDNVSTNTPHTPIAVDTTYTNNTARGEAKYEYVSGNWTVVTGGWNQADEKAFAQASAVNKLYYGLYAEATLEIQNGKGWAGFGFGKATPYTDANDGYSLRYYDNGKVELTNQGKVVAECKVDENKDGGMRFVIEAVDGRIIVYAGQEAKPVLTLQNTGYYNGYVSFYTDGVKADVRNFHHGSTYATWNWVSGNGQGSLTMLSTSDTSSTKRQQHSIATLAGHSFTNFVLTTKLIVAVNNEELDAASGVLLCASEGSSATSEGVFVYLDGKGNLLLSVDGKKQGSYALPENTVSAPIMVVKQNGNYKVFYRGVTEPVLEYQENFNRGGVLSVYTINGQGSFVDIQIENLHANQDYTFTDTAGKWLNSNTKAFSDNLNASASAENYIFYNQDQATFEVKNGVLECYDASNWAAGAGILADTYSDFTLEFKICIEELSSGWTSVGMRKANVTGDHNNYGFSLMIDSSGGIFFFSSEDRKDKEHVKIENFKLGEWYNFKIVAKGSKVTAYVNGQEMTSFTDNKFFEGFINFTSGKQNFKIDDIKVTPMK